MILGLILTIAFGVPGCDNVEYPETATLVIRDARIWTANEQFPWADFIAIRGDRIVMVGNENSVDINDLFIRDDTEVVSADGAMVVPGFIDAHVHFIAGGAGLASVQLRDAATPEEFSSRIAAYANTIEPGEWIRYGSWDHENWGGELPNRSWVDELTPDNPLFIMRLDEHMALANSVALKLAGVDADTPDIAGGTIVRDEDGRPTGILKDNAMNFVLDALPEPSEAQLDREAAAAMDYVAANGVTTVHDVDGWTNLATFRRAEAADKLITRIYSVMPLSTWERLRDEVAENGYGSEWLRIGGLKGLMDGSLGSHTAAFFEPYTDAPDDRGFLLDELENYREMILSADAAALQVMVHAIGDSAIRDLLDIYLDAAEVNGDRDRRFRMEHAQHIHPDDIARFSVQNVIASMQPYHAIDDGRWAEKVIGPERIKTTYAFRSLIDSGAHVAFGSDWSVAPATPIDGIYAAVTRRTLDDANRQGWVPEQKITVEQALRAYTTEAAYSSFEEDVKGSLKSGMLADFVMLDKDLTAIPVDNIRETRILRTYVGGRLVYSAD